MMRSWTAKLLLWASLCSISAHALECGTYLVAGRLKRNRQGHYLLALREKSTSRAELIVLGGSFEERFLKARTLVKAEVYVPRAFEASDRAYVFLQRFLPNTSPQDAFETPTLVRREACGDRARYRP